MNDQENWPPRVPRRDAVRYLKLKHGIEIAFSTLATLATRGGGPRYQKAGRIPLYPLSELDRWAEQRLGELIGSSAEL